MAIYFLDNSALVKRYVNEVASAWVLGLFDTTLRMSFRLRVAILRAIRSKYSDEVPYPH